MMLLNILIKLIMLIYDIKKSIKNNKLNLSYLQKNKTLKYVLDNTNISSLTTNLDFILNLEYIWNHDINKLRKPKITKIHNGFPSLPSELYSLVGKDITKWINNYIQQKHDVYELIIYGYNDSKIKIITNEILHIPIKFLQTILIYFNIKHVIKVVYYPTEFKKRFPDRFESLHGQHVNSGACFHNDNEIYIWRKEEFHKVLFHEIIHTLGIHYFHGNSKDSLGLKHICGNDSLNTFEAFVEFIAVIMNCSYISLYMINSLKLFDVILSIEFVFFLMQLEKIIYHFNISFNDLLPSKISLGCKMHIKTNIYSYFYLKTLMISNINGWVKYKHSLNTKWFVCHDEQELLKFAYSQHNQLENVFNHINHTHTNTSLRMTCMAIKFDSK